MTSQRREMNIQKLLTLRNGYRRLITDELSKFEMNRMSNCEFERLLLLLTETADEIKMINKEIMYHDDVDDLATEVFESKKYSFAMELKLVRLEKQLEEQQITLIENEHRVMSKLSPEQQQTTTDAMLSPEATVFPGKVIRRAGLHTSKHAKSNVLQNTVIGNGIVSSDNCTTEANILFHDGTQRSFIAERPTKELHVTGNGIITINVPNVGDSSQRAAIIRTATMIDITNRKERIPIEVFITPTLAAPLLNIQRDISSLTYFPQTQRGQSHLLNAITSWSPSFIKTVLINTESLTLLHSKSGRRLTTLPHANEKVSHHNREALTKRTMLQCKRSRWKHEYKTLPVLREHQRVSGQNQQTIKVGDVVMVHDEGPRSRWRLVRVDSLIYDNDGRVRATNIRTDVGMTNRSITKLYPLEAG